MPLFEVRCPKCGETKEYIGKSMDAVIKSKCCTKCGANLAPVISVPRFSLKGVGWSNTGYSKCTEDWKK